MAREGGVWTVVGGSTAGGIIVRQGRGRASAQETKRLETGALVAAIEYDEAAGRLHYQLLEGVGPATGWVATSVQGKDLLTRTADLFSSTAPPKSTQEVRKINLQETSQNRPQQTMQQRFSGGGVVSYDSFASKCIGSSYRSLQGGRRAAATTDRTLVAPRATQSEEETHANVVLQDLVDAEATRLREEQSMKRKRRREFGIGWSPEMIPDASKAPEALNCAVSPEGLYSLELGESGLSVRAVPTKDPGAAVNLAYLSEALQVRRKDGREPLFSLDPKPLDEEQATLSEGFVEGAAARAACNAWQVKRFEPAWLSNSSIGEVMFQADVYLKELSMGEHAQPVAGMQSCLDMPRDEEDAMNQWSAREWFVVKSADIQLGGEAREGGKRSTLLPYVELAVEARELVRNAAGDLEDARLTSLDHPLVKYATTFTENFDLIAERKSVLSQLREVAKASIMAKFLNETGVCLGEAWYQLSVPSSAEPPRLMEIPQLWNERVHSELRVKDGQLVDQEQGVYKSSFGLYGGVQFGLDKFRLRGLAQRADLLTVPDETGVIRYGTSTRAAVRAGRIGDVRAGMGLTSGDRALAAPRGVDLCLDRFNLSESTLLADERAVASSEAAARNGVAVGNAFWSALQADRAPAGFADSEMTTLKQVFNSSLADRRSEGHKFMPPDTKPSYLEKLRRLVAKEKAVLEKRRECFCQHDFSASKPGSLFPASWAPAATMVQEPCAEQSATDTLQPRPDYHTRASQLVRGVAPQFDRFTEDGARFRIYRFGLLEVRTVQETDGKEEVLAVFSRKVS